VADIQRNVVKQGKRNGISRHIHARNDKERIAAWKLDLNKILHVFNVRSVVSLWLLLTVHPQTELAINTHLTVSSTHILVSDIHRTIVQVQEGSGGKNVAVSDQCTLVVSE
jgi:hypothetical protein